MEDLALDSDKRSHARKIVARQSWRKAFACVLLTGAGSIMLFLAWVRGN